MYRRVITWSRPTADIKWPWEDEQFKATIDGIFQCMKDAEGFVEKSFVSETELTLINNNDWISKDHWNTYNINPVVDGFHTALDSFVAGAGITKTVTEVDLGSA